MSKQFYLKICRIDNLCTKTFLTKLVNMKFESQFVDGSWMIDASEKHKDNWKKIKRIHVTNYQFKNNQPILNLINVLHDVNIEQQNECKPNNYLRQTEAINENDTIGQ